MLQVRVCIEWFGVKVFWHIFRFMIWDFVLMGWNIVDYLFIFLSELSISFAFAFSSFCLCFHCYCLDCLFMLCRCLMSLHNYYCFYSRQICPFLPKYMTIIKTYVSSQNHYDEFMLLAVSIIILSCEQNEWNQHLTQ